MTVEELGTDRPRFAERDEDRCEAIEPKLAPAVRCKRIRGHAGFCQDDQHAWLRQDATLTTTHSEELAL